MNTALWIAGFQRCDWCRCGWAGPWGEFCEGRAGGAALFRHGARAGFASPQRPRARAGGCARARGGSPALRPRRAGSGPRVGRRAGHSRHGARVGCLGVGRGTATGWHVSPVPPPAAAASAGGAGSGRHPGPAGAAPWGVRRRRSAHPGGSASRRRDRAHVTGAAMSRPEETRSSRSLQVKFVPDEDVLKHITDDTGTAGPAHSPAQRRPLLSGRLERGPSSRGGPRERDSATPELGAVEPRRRTRPPESFCPAWAPCGVSVPARRWTGCGPSSPGSVHRLPAAQAAGKLLGPDALKHSVKAERGSRCMPWACFAESSDCF